MSEIGLKIVVLGDEEVGKTSIILKYVENRFTEDYKPTLGADFAIKEIRYNGVEIKLYLWDIGGTDKYRNLHKFYFEGANVFLIVFDLTRPDTLEHMNNIWLEDIKANSGPVPIILVGNKNDLKDQRLISPEQVQHETSDLIALTIETSAKTGQNIEDLFQKTLKILDLNSLGNK